jgi:competence protein CoiA
MEETMEFAVVEGDPRRKAQPGQRAKCPGCSQAMIAKCGEQRIRIWHWAHERAGTCDFERESETEWHRAWKNQFPEDWRERICSKDGKKHIADVMTESGMVIEFQHSHLEREEREARERFYQKMVWVVNGLRRKRDRALFLRRSVYIKLSISRR